MKRLLLLASFLLFIALCASVAYWAMQMFKPPLRPVAAPLSAQTEVALNQDAAATLFGGRLGRDAVATNYQLRGVIMAGSRDSVAILSADGKSAQAIRVGLEMTPGVTVKEVQRDYILLSDGGAVKRVELPESAKGLQNILASPPVTTARPAVPPPVSQPTPMPGVSTQPMARSQMMPPAAFQPPVPQPGAPQDIPPATQAVPPTSMVNQPPSVQSSGASGTSGTSAAGGSAPAPAPHTSGVPATPAQPAQTVPPGAVPAPANPPR